VIQVDIGGHRPSPTGPKHVSDNFGNLLFLAVFNFQGHFEALNDGFFRKRGVSWLINPCFSSKRFSYRIYLSNELSYA
jgi:hypothetical protein